MKDIFSAKTILAFALGGLLLGSHLVFGFTEPGQLPGGGNVLPPLDTSATGQAKAGGLIINTGGAPVGFIVDKGAVGIGTSTPGGTLGIETSNINPGFLVNQVGSGDIFVAQGRNSTSFSVKDQVTDVFGNLCINTDCIQSWWNTSNLIPTGFIAKTREGVVSFSATSSSALSSEGDVVLNGNVTWSGYHYFNSLRIPNGITVNVPKKSGGLALIVKKDLTIDGTINASYAAVNGTIAYGIGHEAGVCQGDDVGGSAVYDGVVVAKSTWDGSAYRSPVQTPLQYVWNGRKSFLGGASSCAAAGEGGGDLWLNAETVNLGSSATINTRGSSGAGGGNVVIETKSFTDGGATFLNAGGVYTTGYKGADGLVLVANYAAGAPTLTNPITCKTIKTANPSSADGVYLIDPTGKGPTFNAYCDMTTDGGGWTLVFSAQSNYPGWGNNAGLGNGLANTSAATPSGSTANEVRFNTDAKMQTSYIDPMIFEGVLVVNGTKWTKFWKSGLYQWTDFLQQGVGAMNYKNSSGSSSYTTYNYNGYADTHYFQLVSGSDAWLVYSATNFQLVCNAPGTSGGNGNPSKCGVLVR